MTSRLETGISRSFFLGCVGYRHERNKVNSRDITRGRQIESETGEIWGQANMAMVDSILVEELGDPVDQRIGGPGNRR